MSNKAPHPDTDFTWKTAGNLIKKTMQYKSLDHNQKISCTKTLDALSKISGCKYVQNFRSDDYERLLEYAEPHLKRMKMFEKWFAFILKVLYANGYRLHSDLLYLYEEQEKVDSEQNNQLEGNKIVLKNEELKEFISMQVHELQMVIENLNLLAEN